MDLDELAEQEGVTPTPVPVADRLRPELVDAIKAGRRKGHAWSFITHWLAQEHEITISRDGLREYMIEQFPETR